MYKFKNYSHTSKTYDPLKDLISLVNNPEYFQFGFSHFDEFKFPARFISEEWKGLNRRIDSLKELENQKGYSLKYECPGFSKEQVNVNIEGEILKVSGKSNKYGEFSREIHLWDEADREKIEAKLENGVLEIIVPNKKKIAEDKIRKISIS